MTASARHAACFAVTPRSRVRNAQADTSLCMKPAPTRQTTKGQRPELTCCIECKRAQSVQEVLVLDFPRDHGPAGARVADELERPPYVVTAQAKGVTPHEVRRHHAPPNASLVAALFGGSAVNLVFVLG